MDCRLLHYRFGENNQPAGVDFIVQRGRRHKAAEHSKTVSGFAASGTKLALVDVALSTELPHYVGCSTAGRRIVAQIYDQDGVEVSRMEFEVSDHQK